MDFILHNINLTVIILITILIRSIILNRYPPITLRFLWSICILRALVPISVFDFGVMRLIRNLINSKYAVRLASTYFIRGGDDNVTAFQNLDGLADNISKINTVWIIWSLGFIGVMLYFVLNHLKHSKIYSAALPIEEPYINYWKDNHRINRSYRILVSDQIVSPLTYHSLKPIILLPKKILNYDAAQLNLILKHEFVHILHWDVLYKKIITLVVCIHWANPFVWMMWLLTMQDIELHCDSTILKASSLKTRKDYACLLVDMEADKSALAAMTNTLSSISMETRIKCILSSAKYTTPKILLSLIVVLGAFFITEGGSSAALISYSRPTEIEKKFGVLEAKADDFVYVIEQLMVPEYTEYSVHDYRNYVADSFLNNEYLVEVYDRVRFNYAQYGDYSYSLSDDVYNFLFCTLSATIGEYADNTRYTDVTLLRIVQDIPVNQIQIDYQISYTISDETRYTIYERDQRLLKIIGEIEDYAKCFAKNIIDAYDQAPLAIVIMETCEEYSDMNIQIKLEESQWDAL